MSDRPFYPFEIAEPVSFECPDLCVRTRALSQAELPWIPAALSEPSPPRRRSARRLRRIRKFSRPVPERKP